MATPPLSRQRPPIQSGGIRRSFTQPPRLLSFHERAGLDPSDSAADILYSHPRSRIVSFTPPIDAVRSVSSPPSIDLDYPVDTIETLPWASSTEEVLASGSLIIEKIRGSTNFLKSGTKPLHALMRNSQCWCVDGEATLVMRVGAFKYYRIELPYTTEEDKAQVQQLKDVLKRILRFEATPCPFKRGFHVDLPESATTPRKKGPWKRRPGSSLSSPGSPSPSPLSLRKSRAQATPSERETEVAVASPQVDAKEPSEDGFRDVGSAEEKNQDVRQVIGVEDDGTAASIVSDQRNGKEKSNFSPDSTWMADGLHERRPEADDDDAEEERERVDDQLVPDVPAVEDHSPEASDGQVEDQSENHTDLDPPSEGLEASNFVSASLGRIEHGDADSESTEKSYSPSDQQSDTPPDSPSSLVSPDDVPDNSLDKKNVISSYPEKPTARDLADSSYSTEARGENFQKQATINTTKVTEAHETHQAHEPESKLENKPAESKEPGQLRPKSPTHSVDEVHSDKDSQERSAKEVLDDVESQSLSPQSEPQMSDTVSVSSRADSFHSTASSHGNSSVLEPDSGDFSDPTPLAEAHDPLTIPHPQHRRDISEMTVTADHAPTLEADVPVSPLRPSTETSEGPSTPSLLRSSASDSSWPEVETPVAITTDNNLRRRSKKKRSFSPLPPSSTLFTSSPQSPRGNHLTGAILQKACYLAIGKPIELVAMLVHIFARIAGGATVNDLMNGDLFRQPVQRAPEHRRNNSLPGQPDPRKGEALEEDDYGVPIRGRSRSAAPMVRKDDDADSLYDLD